MKRRLLCAVLIIATSGLGGAALAQKAPAEACAAKLDALKAGQSADITADVEWIGSYCEDSVREQAVNFIGLATAEAATDDARAAGQEAAAQARGDIAAIHAEANAASNGAILNNLAAGPAPVGVSVTHVTVVRPVGGIVHPVAPHPAVVHPTTPTP